VTQALDVSKALGIFEPELVLRKWFYFEPSMEFRCFIKNSTIIGRYCKLACGLSLTNIGISQRNDTVFYDYLPSISSEIRTLIEDFFLKVVKSRFPLANCRLYIGNLLTLLDSMDVYVKWTEKRVFIIDFSPLSREFCDPILFSWSDLDSKCEKDLEGCEMRIVESDQECRLSFARQTRGPMDIEGLSSSFLNSIHSR